MKSKWSWFAVSGLLVALVGAFCSCGSSGGTTPTSTTTLSAKLYSGTVGRIDPSISKAVSKAVTPDAPLEGYQLYCVTFSTPPLSGTGTSGADGSVTVEIGAGSADLGCFVLDADGTSVATSIFTSSDLTQSGQTIAASDTADFGTITTSLEWGVASGTIPSNVTIDTTTPSAATCPEGTWVFDTGEQNPECPEGTTTTGIFWIAKTPEGNYIVSYTTYNIGLHPDPDDPETAECLTASQSGITATWDGTTLTIPAWLGEEKQLCPNKYNAAVITPDATCTTATGTRTAIGCGVDHPEHEYCYCPECGGAETCDTAFTMTRQ